MIQNPFAVSVHSEIAIWTYGLIELSGVPLVCRPEPFRTSPVEEMTRAALLAHPGMEDDLVDLSEALEGESPEILAARIDAEASFSWNALLADAG